MSGTPRCRNRPITQAAQKDPQDNSLTLSLDRAPKIKPLLDRR